MLQHRRDSEGGFTFAELAFGLLIFVISAAVLINHLTVNYQTTATERDRVFAFSKAQAILAEIQNFVDRGDASSAVDLDTLDDGVVTRPNLTIQMSDGVLLPADHVLSGNVERGGGWLWSRRITVQPFQGLDNRNVRYVTVRIMRRDRAGIEHPVADLSSVINSAPSAFPTTQVFDVYFLAIENIPGWWVYMDAIRPFVESMVTDLETRNPGLSVRTHWITKAAYGRSQSYTPHINENVDSWAPIPSVYHYPGLMPAGSASGYYYVPGSIAARMAFDGTLGNGYDATTNPFPYALADYYNQAMREPDERAYHQLRVNAIEQREAEIAADIAAGSIPRAPLADMSKEPTMRLLMEDMNTDPDLYRNALLINLHGELMPMPAVRNYSDAAKAPEAYPDVRAVTHPEELRTARGPGATSDDVRLRVYTYVTDPDEYMASGRPGILPEPIAIEVAGMNLTDVTTSEPDLHPSVSLDRLVGGVTVAGVQDYLPFAAAPWDEAATPKNPARTDPDEMFYEAEFVTPGGGLQPFTRILLYNSPVVAPEFDNRGVYNQDDCRLYDMEYVPCATTAAADFSRDLSSPGDMPKNTARWLLTIPGTAFPQQLFVDNFGNAINPAEDVQLAVRTRIWTGVDPATSGTLYPPAAMNSPDNLSTTYTWWADSREDVPMTERSQFMGDPRHCPYRDVLSGDSDYGDGYNWYFDRLQNSGNAAARYQGLNAGFLQDRWRNRMNCDIPRMFEVMRSGLVSSEALYTTLTGFSYYYVGNGADIGYDSANGYPNSIPVDQTPYGSPGMSWYTNNITGSRHFVRSVSGGSNYWVGLPWLGELYPDDQVAQWRAIDATGEPRGNLSAGTSGGQFYMRDASSVYGGSRNRTYGTRIHNHQQRTAGEGCTSFFNIGTNTSTFHHRSAGGNGNLVGSGLEMANNYNMPVPLSAPISRPFLIDTGGGVGNEWWNPPYSTNRFSANLAETYYNHGTGWIGSGLVELTNPTKTSAAYIVVNGIDRTVQSGSAFIAQWSMLTLFHSYFEAGDPTRAHRIVQPPRIEIDTPTDITELDDPSSIWLRWSTSWTRWDGLPYTETMPVGFTEAENQIEYALLYSRDGGESWLHIQDDTPATPGVRPALPVHRVADAGNGQESLEWMTPSASFPEASYLLQIEAYRENQALHYSFHRTKFFLQR